MPDLIERMTTLQPGDHLCLIYDNDPVEQMPALVPFIRQGLELGERCVYVADDQTIDDLKARLQGAGIDVSAEVDRGALVLWSREEWRQPGVLSSAGKEQQVRSAIAAALDSGYTGIRFAVEMTWTLDPDIEPEALAHWEATLNTIFTPDVPARIVCQYSRRRLSPEVIRAGLATHPMAILGMDVRPNPYYEAPLLLSPESEHARVDWMLASLDRARLAEEQRERLIRGEATLEASERSRQQIQELYLESERARHAAEALNQETQSLLRRLQQSEEELRDFFDNGIVGMHWVDRDGIILRANRAELEMLGYSEEEYVGQHVGQFHADPETIEEMLTRLRRGETLHDFRAKLRRKDGALRDVEMSSGALWRDGEFLHSRCFTRDVTETLKSQEAAFHLAAVVNGSDDAIVSKDLRGVIRSWNLAAERMFGYTADEAIGQSVRMIVPADRQSEEDEILSRVSRGEAVDHLQTRRRRKDGAEILVSLSVSPVRDSSGHIIGASKIARDITERSLREREFVRTLAQRAAILESVVDCVITFDADGVICDFNSAAERTFGCRASQAVGAHVSGFVIPADSGFQQPRDLADLVLRSDSALVGARSELLGIRASGERFPVEAAISAAGADGDARITLVLHDITERKLAEESLHQSLALKDQFLSLVSHELRTPATTILGNVQILSKRWDALPPNVRHQAFADVASEADRLVSIIENLLLLTRINTGGQVPCESVKLSPLVAGALEAARRRQPDREIRMEADEVPAVSAEPVLLQLVIDNLVSNAMKYSPSDQPVEVCITSEAPGRARVTVADRGIGIAGEDAEAIFTPFFRTAHAKATAPGMGLGLAVCRRAVEAQGGELDVRARVGGGSEFSFTLRWATEE